MSTGTGWSRGRAKPGAGNACRVGIDGEPWSEQRLHQRRCTADDVAPDVVRVVDGHLGGGPHGSADDAFAEPGSEALDLADDRVRRVARVPGRDVRVGP